MKVLASIRNSVMVDIPDDLVNRIIDLGRRFDYEDVWSEWHKTSEEFRDKVLEQIPTAVPKSSELMYAECRDDSNLGVVLYEE